MNYDPTDLRAEEERKIEQTEVVRIKRIREDADLRWLARQEPFRRLVWRVLGEVKAFDEIAGPLTEFAQGQRNVGMRLFRELEAAAPGTFERMLGEHREKQEMKSK
jgi:hypothetical protein